MSVTRRYLDRGPSGPQRRQRIERGSEDPRSKMRYLRVMSDPSRIPVIVGVGQVNDRVEDDMALDSLGLMLAALTQAERDASGGWMKQVQSLAVVDQLSFPGLIDLPAIIAAFFNATPKHCTKTPYPSGESPVRLLNEAAERIRAGEIEVAAVVGGEALRTAARRAKVSGAAEGRDAVRESAQRVAKTVRKRHGLVAPTDIYPLYENALRASLGQTLAEGQAESAKIWAQFSEVAEVNPHAWLRKRVSAAEIATPSANNRPIAFPYTKLMVANQSVNQGAGFIVASLAKARVMGVAEHRLVYVGRGAGASEPRDVLTRESYDRSIALETTLTQALAFNGLETSDLDFVELYSCFPCIPKLARRAIGWPVEKPMSVVGGLTFGGGPVGNYMSHAVAVMTERLRREGRHALLFGNGGFANTNHAIVLSREPGDDAGEPRSSDVQAEADARRRTAPVFADTHTGPGVIETYTVFFDRDGAPTHGVVVALTPDSARFLAHVPGDDAEAIAFLTDGRVEPVGMLGDAVAGDDGLTYWRRT
jgi:acetyl-CoA C-acetyltransferase